MLLNFENIIQYKLDNGLEVILYQDKDIPMVTTNIWYRVGSSSEVGGKTGLTHLFEHMMFQGSKNVAKGEHFRFIQEAGGLANASTSIDRTNYYNRVPSNFIELPLWLEADRMGSFVDSINQEKLSNQIDVVKNERLERYDNQPYGLAWELIFSNMFNKKHPYHAPVIGWMNDILSYSIEDVVTFYKKHYGPSNACLVLAGDIEFESSIKLIEKYFAGIPRFLTQAVEIDYDFSSLKESLKITKEETVDLEKVFLVWQSAKAFDVDDSVYGILSDLLTGSKNGRLHKDLVLDQQLAISVSANQSNGKYDGLFWISSTGKTRGNLEQIKNIIFHRLEEIAENGVEERELQRSKNSLKSGYVMSLESIVNIADRLNLYNFYTGNPNGFEIDYQRFSAISSEEVQSCAKKLLNSPFFELQFLPKET
ncbi:MAG TPA: pitrilysin family protein [Ignavibacteriaceae bacterium]|nr:pitrilysin family protein [Ignavibacteriaceae bacterium]